MRTAAARSRAGEAGTAAPSPSIPPVVTNSQTTPLLPAAERYPAAPPPPAPLTHRGRTGRRSGPPGRAAGGLIRGRGGRRLPVLRRAWACGRLSWRWVRRGEGPGAARRSRPGRRAFPTWRPLAAREPPAGGSERRPGVRLFPAASAGELRGLLTGASRVVRVALAGGRLVCPDPCWPAPGRSLQRAPGLRPTRLRLLSGAASSGGARGLAERAGRWSDAESEAGAVLVGPDVTVRGAVRALEPGLRGRGAGRRAW
ncbi:unnamed protein product [Nyctereutes procyonoides]|uniref:(raccoon dog) hypothetical protein n=1 Tax=Nyctereutes procyonoides TaxID=34880 RepID=A0A811Z2H9_NYCPR|nr:unnamed protein product [Nyctereutes procyonoides]